MTGIQSLGQSPAVVSVVWLNSKGDPNATMPCQAPPRAPASILPLVLHSHSSQITTQSICKALDSCNVQETKMAKLWVQEQHFQSRASQARCSSSDSVDMVPKCRGPDWSQPPLLRLWVSALVCGLGQESRNDLSLFSLEFLKTAALLPEVGWMCGENGNTDLDSWEV